ncbi:MAG: sulfite exporter TauE/SafE family protein [Chloroflexi bacterium]|nr:sulfite exporter TauE/SafE family protein [Chloroflexota bacterium]
MLNLEWYIYLAVLAAGFGAGFINTLAGSGSLITLPLLIFLGLPATVANGTNRVGVLFQTAVATNSFHRQKILDVRSGLILAIPAVIGSLIGAGIAVNLNEEAMRRAIGALMIVMLVVILVEPKRWLEGRPNAMSEGPDWKQMIIFFGVGIYGGFIQAGVGIFLLAGLVLSVGYDLVRSNAIKSLIVLCFTISAMIVFIINDQIHWGIGLILAVGNGFGGWVAARMAVKKGAGFVRYLLIAVVVVSAANLLGVIDFIRNLF